MHEISIAEALWPQGASFKIPSALYCVPFTPGRGVDDTRFLLIEAIVQNGKGGFGSTPDRDYDLSPKPGRPADYTHSLIYLIDKEKGVISAAFAPYYVKGLKKFGGDFCIRAIKDIAILVTEGMENYKGLYRLRHKGVYQTVPGRVHAQENLRPKYFCVNHLSTRQFEKALRFLESFHARPRDYQIAGYGGYNCDRFRRAAREAAGLPVSALGRICPWPAFRAVAIQLAAKSREWGLPLSEARHYGPEVTVKMLRQAYRKGTIPKPYVSNLFDLAEPEAEREKTPQRLIDAMISRRRLIFGALSPV